MRRLESDVLGTCRSRAPITVVRWANARATNRDTELSESERTWLTCVT
jgi:hypothetical protein